jgi:formylglycine-generating enzyme required for sulfatase activity
MKNCRLTNRGGVILLRVFAFLAVFTTLTTFAQGPVVSNVRASQRAGTRLVDIYYDVASISNRLTVAVSVSTNGGADYALGATNFVGAVGTGVPPGTNRLVTWNAGAEWTAGLSTNVRFRIVADDLEMLPMVLIPGGAFTMGDTLDGPSDAKSVTNVLISPFYMDVNLVTWSQWQGVYGHATNHGYTFVNQGAGKGPTHPVQSVNWYDTVKWCNARSEQAGKVPVYYTDAGLTVVYRSGEVAPYANWGAKGYRLPTEAEWEKAARGGLAGQRFPWGNLISQTNANYYGATGSYAYDLGPNGYNPIGNYPTTSPGTSPVGSFAPNGYGLNDMAGNVWQWCWDWYGTPYAGGTDPRGVSSGSFRVGRGGSWLNDASGCRAANRGYDGPAYRSIIIGFRSALPPGQ